MDNHDKWVKENIWMIFIWILRAKKQQFPQMQTFISKNIISIIDVQKLDLTKTYNEIMWSLFRSIVFGCKNKFPICLDGFWTKYGKYPKLSDIQLYYNLEKGVFDWETNMTLHNIIYVNFYWEFKE